MANHVLSVVFAPRMTLARIFAVRSKRFARSHLERIGHELVLVRIAIHKAITGDVTPVAVHYCRPIDDRRVRVKGKAAP